MQTRDASRQLKEGIRAARKKATSAQLIYGRAFTSPDDALPFLVSVNRLLTELFDIAADGNLDGDAAALGSDSIRTAALYEKYTAGEATAFSRADLLREIEVTAGRIRVLEKYRINRLAGPMERALVKSGRFVLLGAAVLGIGGVIAALVYGLSLPGYDQGLTGNYFPRPNFAGKRFQTVDHQINFSWEDAPPIKGMPRDRFSIRWEGCIRVDQSDGVKLAASADDDVRVYVDGELLIDTRGKPDKQALEISSTVAKGVHPVEIQYRDLRGPAQVFFGWIRQGERVEPVPASSLLPRNVLLGGAGSNQKCPKMPKLREPKDRP